MPAPTPTLLELRSGLRLECVDFGPRDGVPVAMLHGITDSWRSFEPLLPHLPAGVRAIALSQRGHGDSDRPDAGYSSRDFADDLAAALDALQVRSAYVLGHSMGATNALRFATQYPARTRGLLLVGAFATYADNAGLVEFVRTEIEPLADPVPRALALAFQESTLAHAIDPVQLRCFVDESLKVPARVWRAAFAGLLDDDVLAAAGRIVAPARLVWGTEDAFCRAEDRVRLARALPHASVRLQPDAGHALHWEDPVPVARDLATLLGHAAAAA